MRSAILFFAVFTLLTACNSKNSFDNKLLGNYMDPATGAIMLTIQKEDTVAIAFSPRIKYFESEKINGNVKSSVEAIDLENHQLFDYCGGLEEQMKIMTGSTDWRKFVKQAWQLEDAFLLKVEKGFQSLEHVYQTDFVLISGSDCLNHRIYRVNLEHID